MIEKGASDAEKHDVQALMENASVDFTANPGKLDAKAVRKVLFRAFWYYGRFKIYYPRPLVDLADSKETAGATVYFVVLKKDYVLPGLKGLYEDPQGWIAAVGNKADLYELELTFQKKKGRWQVRRARLHAIKGMAPG